MSNIANTARRKLKGLKIGWSKKLRKINAQFCKNLASGRRTNAMNVTVLEDR
jgi:hypothetical protein